MTCIYLSPNSTGNTGTFFVAHLFIFYLTVLLLVSNKLERMLKETGEESVMSVVRVFAIQG